MPSPHYVAVDLGAGSGRVFLSGLEDRTFYLEEIRRFTYPPRKINGVLRWDLEAIFRELCLGLKDAGERARSRGAEVKSVGIDSWAVDYGLIDEKGELLADPACYRDSRTEGKMEYVFERIPRWEIFEKTGVQFQNFNTLYQLSSEKISPHSGIKMLLLPDLIGHRLTGKIVCEYTNATTTQMVNAATGSWDLDLLSKAGIDASILPEIIPSGTDLGRLLPRWETELRLAGVEVVAPATHDTGSAIAAAPLDVDSAFISSGTWSLVGAEIYKPLVTAEAERGNFTNEGGVFGTVRFLKNVSGLWILESCRSEWQKNGIEVSYDRLIDAAFATDKIEGLIFPDDPRFLNPPSMIQAVSEQLAETGQKIPDEPAGIAKVIFDSLAFRYGSVLRSVERLTGRRFKKIEIVGGGGRNQYLNQMTASVCGIPVRSGLYEATIVGNIIVQAITGGRFDDLSEARGYVEANTRFTSFAPSRTEEIERAAILYRSIEERFAAYA